MPFRTAFAKGLSHYPQVYIYGGICEDKASEQTVLVYDVLMKNWSKLPTPCSCSGAAIIGNQFTLIGGKDTRGTPSNKLLTWTGKVWQKVYPPMHTARSMPGVLAIKDLVIVSGGIGADGKEVDTIEFLDIKNRKWIQSNLKLPQPVSRHHMALCGKCIYIYHWDKGYFWRMKKKNFMASLTNNYVHRYHWEEHDAPVSSSLLQYSTLPVLVSESGVIILAKKWTHFSEETSYRNTCTASLNGTTFLIFGGYQRRGGYQTRAVQYDIAVEVSKLLISKQLKH